MRDRLVTAGRLIRPVLDALYNASGVLAAIALLAILVIIVAQMVARWTAVSFPGGTDYAGYAMASASFFAFSYALNHGSHIRVSLFLQRLGGGKRRAAELWCYGVGGFLASYFAWFAIKAVRVSYKLNDISQGQDATPLWIPQMVMAIGTLIFAVALVDRFVCIVFGAPITPEHEGSDRAHAE
ncbi:MAG: TRAP transporter small permease [Alphaproteobacteria bacterium]